MPGGGKPIAECSSQEIRALLIAGTVIAGIIGIGSFWSRQPGWFLWPVRVICVIWLATLWHRATWELRSRRQAAKPAGLAHDTSTLMNSQVITHDPFERLIVSLRADGLAGDADRLHSLIHEVAWTTGSELVGELGKEIRKIHREQANKFSSCTRGRMDEAMRWVTRVWPDFL